MKKQVSIKVYLDEDLYQFYTSIEDGRKGQVVREALMLYRDLRGHTSANNIADILAEIKQGFQKIESLLKEKPNPCRFLKQRWHVTGFTHMPPLFPASHATLFY